MKISVILIIAMVGIFFIFGIYGLITFDLSIQEMKKLHGTRNEGFTFNMMQDLDENIDKRLTNFKDLTKLEVFQETLKESNEEFRALENIPSFIEQMEEKIEFDGKPTALMKGIVEEELEDKLIETIQFYKDEYEYDVVEELFVTNEFGANVALGVGTSDYQQDDEEWWQITKNEGLFIGTLEFREDYESYVMQFGIRVDDSDGNFIGVMRVVLTLDDLIKPFINDAEIINNPARNVVLLDNSGKTIYSNGIQDFEQLKPVSYFGKIATGKNVGTIELADELEEVRLVSYAKSTGYKTFPGFGWVVLVDQSSSSFVEEFLDLRNLILLVSILGMIAAVVIGVVVSFFITKPLKKLTNLAKLFSEGQFDAKAEKSVINEIEVIGQSFNNMSKSLKKLIETEKQLAEAHARVKKERLTAIGELAASVAHDMKNPLATIRSSAEIVKRHAKGDSKDIDEVLNRMDRAIGRMSHQIEDVLNFVRVTPLHTTNVSIRSIFDSAMESLEIPKNVEIQLPETKLEIKCDARKMEVVFINLILNAIQSIGKREGKIKLKVSEQENFVLIEVEDTGPGISEEILPKIFDPLTTTKEKGTGLGLSTCKNIIEQHGGSITAKNNPTVFTLKLPKNNE